MPYLRALSAGASENTETDSGILSGEWERSHPHLLTLGTTEATSRDREKPRGAEAWVHEALDEHRLERQTAMLGCL